MSWWTPTPTTFISRRAESSDQRGFGNHQRHGRRVCRRPAFVFHLLEYFDVAFDLDVDEVNARWRELAAVDRRSQMVIKETSPVVQLITAAPPTGQYSYDPSGALVYRCAPLDYLDPTAGVWLLEEAVGWAPRRTPDVPTTLRAFLLALPQGSPHDGPFVVKVSSWPTPQDPWRLFSTLAAFDAINAEIAPHDHDQFL